MITFLNITWPTCTVVYAVMHVQLKLYLADNMDRRASSAVAEARQWISDARSKVAWCAETDIDVDRDGIEARLSVISDLYNSVSDGELIRDTALHRAQNALQAAAESTASRQWSNQCQQLSDSWTEFTAELQHTR